jgi:hypothetical protein
MSSSFSIEDSSPYHLHHGDSPGTVLVSQPLDGDNCHTWSRSMVMALTAKNKLSFLNGSLAKPVMNPVLNIRLGFAATPWSPPGF